MVDNIYEVECPICNKRLKVITMTHLKIHGYTNKNDFINEYPTAVLVSKKYEESNRLLRKEIFTKLNKSETQRKKASEHCKRLNQDSQRQSNKGKLGWTYERRQEKSKQLKETSRLINTSPEYEEFRKRRNQGLSYGKRHEYIAKDGRVLKLKSFTECRAAKYLETNDFIFEYESIEIPYISLDKKEHHYFPDFYLPEYNLLFEVKPIEFQSDEVVLLKRKAALSLGYQFLFVSESDLSRYKELTEKIIALGTK